MQDYRSFIEATLKDAAKIASKHFGRVTGVVKAGDNNQVLTEADIEIGTFIVDRVKEHYPDHTIIDEEAGVIDNGSSYTWVIDPIDGTSNFASGIPTYGIMIGLLSADQPVAGGIAIPASNEIYSASKGQGATCNGKNVTVSQETNLLNALVAYGIDGHQEDASITQQEVALLGEIILHIRNLRTSNSVFDQVQVAKGSYGATMNRTSKIWDNVAQQIIIEEAGGVYTDFYGVPIDYSNPISKVNDTFTWCAAPVQLHKQLMHIINK